MRRDLYVSGVLDKCGALKRSGLWAPEPHLRPKAWLSNFQSADDRLLAAILLDNFIYYSDRTTDQLLRSTYYRLVDGLLTGMIGLGTPNLGIDDLIFTPILGERPNPTDSGNLFSRKVRNTLRIPQARIKEHAEAYALASAGSPIVFLDDFVGSGAQFINTWVRETTPGSGQSFKQLYTHQPFPIILLALVVTSQSIARIRTEVPTCHLAYAHTLDVSYSAKALAAPILEPSLQDIAASLDDFLDRYSKLLTLSPDLQHPEHPKYGWYAMGLMLGFEHSIPDSTLPIFWCPGAGDWSQLVTPR
nr:hypothetical protein [Kofleriaceae bacterium]